MDFYLFSNDYIELDPVTMDNYENYIASIDEDMGGTNYFPVLKAIFDKKFKSGGFLGI